MGRVALARIDQMATKPVTIELSSSRSKQCNSVDVGKTDPSYEICWGEGRFEGGNVDLARFATRD